MWDFAKTNPGYAFLMVCAVAWLASRPFWIVNRWLRSRNIVAQGWPPPHLDADGDTHHPDDDESKASIKPSPFS